MLFLRRWKMYGFGWLLLMQAVVCPAQDSAFTFAPYISRDLRELGNLWEVQRSLVLQGESSPRRRQAGTDDITGDLEKSGLPPVWQKGVAEFVQQYVHNYPKEMEIMLGYADFFDPLIQKELERASLDGRLATLPMALSAMNAGKVSSSGLAGLWQLSYVVARRYGLRIDDEIDERFNPLLCTRAATRYLRHLMHLYKDEDWAVLALMTSPAAVNRARMRAGRPDDPASAIAWLPEEGRAQWYAYQSLHYLRSTYKTYKLRPLEIDMPVVTDTVQVPVDFFFRQAAVVMNLPEERIRALNKACKKNWLPAQYPMLLPVPYKKRFEEMRDSILAYSDSLMVHPDSAFAVTMAAEEEKSDSGPPADAVELYYRVKPGDNLGFIASWYDVRVSRLKSWNDIRSDMIQVGEDLVIYVPKEKESYYKVVDALSFSEKQARQGKNIPEKKETPPEETAAEVTPPSGEYEMYEVKKGDSLWGIARKYPGVSEYDIMRWNGITSQIKPGQQLRIYKVTK